MDQTALLLEYLKEQYTQARQYETREANATTFLTALAGALLGLAFKEGAIRPESCWIGALIILIGLANWWINKAHIKGTLYHNALAGETRKSLENATEWTVSKPSEMRKKILADHKVGGPESSIRENVHAALSWVPWGVITLGLLVVLISLWRHSLCGGSTT
jgi:hypothetical protein